MSTTVRELLTELERDGAWVEASADPVDPGDELRDLEDEDLDREVNASVTDGDGWESGAAWLLRPDGYQSGGEPLYRWAAIRRIDAAFQGDPLILIADGGGAVDVDGPGSAGAYSPEEIVRDDWPAIRRTCDGRWLRAPVRGTRAEIEDVTSEVWVPTHVVTVETGDEVPVMLIDDAGGAGDGRAYTAAEWAARIAPRYRWLGGDWLCEGQQLAGTVRQLEAG
jgi:hypothetical protein